MWPSLGPRWKDALVAVALAVLAGAASYRLAQWIHPVVLDAQTSSVFFEADVPRVFANMTDRWSSHYRTEVHPLFSIIAYPPVRALRSGLGLTPVTAVHIVDGAVAGLWAAMLFIAIRLLGCRRVDAVLFTALASVSAAALFWFAVPETYGFGSLTILVAVVVVALAERRRLAPAVWVAVSVITMSVTITNWMAGVLATALYHPWRRALQLTLAALAVVVGFSAVQMLLFSNARPPLVSLWSEISQYAFTPGSGGPGHVTTVFALGAIVMPAIQSQVSKPDWPEWPLMSVQLSAPGSASSWGALATLLWIPLLAIGAWSLVTVASLSRVRATLGLTLLGQLVLHLVYGNETFLYALHWAPLLVLVAALGTRTRARPVVLLLAVGVTTLAAVNNLGQLRAAARFLTTHGPARHQVEVAMRTRPDDPWPRGIGHVVLALPGSREEAKAYHEPGGSFSPAVGSFGVAIWAMDPAGARVTSDQVPIGNVEQRLAWADGRTIPDLATRTPYYDALWAQEGPGRFTLRLRRRGPARRLALVVRSVGPAGGPIVSLAWDGSRLLINDGWSVHVEPGPHAMRTGREGAPGWTGDAAGPTAWRGEDGWGYAWLGLGAENEVRVVIERGADQPSPALASQPIGAALDLALPDPRFRASLDAQVAHLTMGLVDRQTRPGEPTNYPLAWLRDGAYVVAALARAGQLGVAQALAADLAERDFFGGFGAESDAPGLAIWALEEVAVRARRPELDRQLWPHVQRKAERIVAMTTAIEPMHARFTGPIVPALRDETDLTLVCLPARDGLVVGRMDNHFPELFVNAVSYRGLLDAAALADRVGEPATAARWRAAAVTLRAAWERAFTTRSPGNWHATARLLPLAITTGFQPAGVPVSMRARGAALKVALKHALDRRPPWVNERTYVASLWPSWVASGVTDLFTDRLDALGWRPRATSGAATRPPWTYFEVAKAHQWLLLDRPDRVWSILDWFWNHQASPGLYTWWEGYGEENTFHRWERVRGWVRPPHVTPHYWTAAEMLMLQLDMLAYVDERAPEPTIIVGAGIPAAWLAEPMHVRGISTRLGHVDWHWVDGHMRVAVIGARPRIRLGQAFQPRTPLEVEYVGRDKDGGGVCECPPAHDDEVVARHRLPFRPALSPVSSPGTAPPSPRRAGWSRWTPWKAHGTSRRGRQARVSASCRCGQ